MPDRRVSRKKDGAMLHLSIWQSPGAGILAYTCKGFKTSGCAEKGLEL